MGPVAARAASGLWFWVPEPPLRGQSWFTSALQPPLDTQQAHSVSRLPAADGRAAQPACRRDRTRPLPPPSAPGHLAPPGRERCALLLSAKTSALGPWAFVLLFLWPEKGFSSSSLSLDVPSSRKPSGLSVHVLWVIAALLFTPVGHGIQEWPVGSTLDPSSPGDGPIRDRSALSTGRWLLLLVLLCFWGHPAPLWGAAV